MPINIQCNEQESYSIDDFRDAFFSGKYKMSDQESAIELAPHLKKLHNNRTFLGDMMIKSLVDTLEDQQKRNGYTSQVFLITRLDRDTFVRANVWPSTKDDIYIRSGPEAFFYGIPHDHNFNFLTVGYWGPGYESDYYEYLSPPRAGHPGDKVEVKPVGRQRLGQGEMMLYRKGIDIHKQLPPSETSISLNVMDSSGDVNYQQQYILNNECTEVQSLVSRRCSPAVFNIAASLEFEKAIEPLSKIAHQHDDAYTRFQALRAVARAAQTKSDAISHLEIAANSSCDVVSGWSRYYLERLGQPKTTAAFA